MSIDRLSRDVFLLLAEVASADGTTHEAEVTALAQAGHSVSMISQASSESSICFVVPEAEARVLQADPADLSPEDRDFRRAIIERLWREW